MFDAEHPWDFFKHIFVLNLPHRTDRKEHMQKHLSRFPNLNYSFFDGIFGRESKHIVEYALAKQIIKLIPDDTGEVLNIGQVACIISHYLIWEHCLLNMPTKEKGYWILILEDDAEFHPDFNNQMLYDYLIHLPKDAKYFKMGYQFAEQYSKMSFGNGYWNKLGGQVFSTIAYAVHTDLLLPFLTTTYSSPLDWYPIVHSYGMVDINKHLLTQYSENKVDPYFSYDYHFSRENVVYKHTGSYGGVLRSFKYEVDSDINFFAQQLRLKNESKNSESKNESNEINFSDKPIEPVEPVEPVEPIKTDKSEQKELCVVMVCNKPYFQKFIETCQSLVSNGKYTKEIGEICLMIGDDLKDDPLLEHEIIKKYNVQIVYFPKIECTREFVSVKNSVLLKYRNNKLFQYYKLYLFTTFFKKWKYIFYIDCGMHIYSDIQPILEKRIPHTLLAHSDAYPTFERKLICQFDETQTFYFNTLKNEYDTNIDYFQTTMMLFSTEIIEKDTFNHLYQLMLKYPNSNANDQGILALYFSVLRPVWKQIPLQNDSTYFYDFTNRYEDKPYIMVKYPDIMKP